MWLNYSWIYGFVDKWTWNNERYLCYLVRTDSSGQVYNHQLQIRYRALDLLSEWIDGYYQFDFKTNPNLIKELLAFVKDEVRIYFAVFFFKPFPKNCLIQKVDCSESTLWCSNTTSLCSETTVNQPTPSPAHSVTRLSEYFLEVQSIRSSILVFQQKIIFF